MVQKGCVYFPSPSSLEEGRSLLSAEERDVLERINRKVAGAESLDAVMDFVFEATRDLFPCDRIGLAFIEDEGRRVVSHWARALYEPVLLGKGYAQDLRGSTLEQVLETGSPRIINDLEEYLEAKPESSSTQLIVREGVRASMTCPLTVDGRAIGFLFRSSRVAQVYGGREAAMHLAIAERLSQAVEKAWVIEQLASANRAYFEMLGFVSHELKSPLASLVMDAETLLGGYVGDLEEPQQVKVRKMVTKANYLLQLIREYLNLAKIESEHFDLNPRQHCDFVAEVVTPACDIIEALMEQQGVSFHADLPEGGLEADCDCELLQICMVNLLGNAVKYGQEAGGEIRLRATRENGALRVSVWNRGPGFPPEEKGRLFRKFSRLQAPELRKKKGTGVGLYTTWRIIQLHGGRIWAESKHGEWAEFIFEIPQPLPDNTDYVNRRAV